LLEEQQILGSAVGVLVMQGTKAAERGMTVTFLRISSNWQAGLAQVSLTKECRAL